MSIKVRCPSCGKGYQLSEERAGRRVTCKACGEKFEVPQPENREAVAVAAKSEPRAALAAEESRALEEALKKKPRGRFTTLALGLTAAVLVLMLACGGTVVLIIAQARQAAKDVTAELNRAQEEARRAREAADAEREKTRKALEEERQRLENQKALVRQPGLMDIDLSKLDLTNLPEGIFGRLSPEQAAKLKQLLQSKLQEALIKNHDDALKMMRSKKRDEQLAAIQYVTVQITPADKRKDVLDALRDLINGDDAGVSDAAKTAKLVVENE